MRRLSHLVAFCLTRVRHGLASLGVNSMMVASLLAIANIGVFPALTTAARADVASAMDDAFSSMGAAANVTGPTAYQGQSSGYYSLGNVWMRMPQKQTTLANIQFPNGRGGCGGIDIFAGSFSFINAGEMVALMKAVANNAVGFAFKLALDTVCPECGAVIEQMRQAAQLMNNQSINSCQMAAGLVGSVWPKSDRADQEICQQFGNSTGVFTDMAAAMSGCGPGGSRTSTLKAAAADPATADINPGVPRNFTWHVLKKSAFFAPGGVLDRELAQYVMTVVGTVIYVPPQDGANGAYNPIAGDTSSELISALLDGTTSAPVKVWSCDASEPDDACINPTLVTLNVPPSKSIRNRVLALLDGIMTAIHDDTPITADQKALLQVASVPLYKILSVQAAASRGLPDGDRHTLAEITSIDLLYAIIDQFVSEVGKSKVAFIATESEKGATWQAQLDNAKAAIGQRQNLVQIKVGTLMDIIQRTAFLESTLASALTPSMAASLDWSRGVSARGLN